MVIIAIIRRMVTTDIVWVNIVCIPPFCWGGGGLNLQLNFEKKGGVTGARLLERVAGKEGLTFSGSVAIFL